MATNNMVTLIGNIGDEARIHLDKDGKEFAGLSVATTDSYQNDKEEWIDKDTVWHNVLAFSPSVVAILKTLKKGSRIKLEGYNSYTPFDVMNGDGEMITKRECAVIARRVEQAPLVKKSSS